MVGGELDDADGVGNYYVYNGDSVDWNTVYNALRGGESLTYNRSNKRKGCPTSSSCVRGSKRDRRTTTASTKVKGKFDVWLVDEEFEQEHIGNIDVSKGEEGEGFVLLDVDDYNKNEDDYAEVDEDSGGCEYVFMAGDFTFK